MLKLMKKLEIIPNLLLLFVLFCFIIKSIYKHWRRRGLGELIAVLSGKGGTGKTSVCAGLATALADKGHTVLCIDCDVGLRNLDISLGISELGALSFLDVCGGNYSLDQAAKHPEYPNLSFLTAPISVGADGIDPWAFGEMLRKARQRYAYIFLDAPAGVDEGFRLAARFSDRVILVTGPDPGAIRDAGRTGELLELMGKTNVRLVVNRVSRKMASAMNLTIDDVMDASGLPLLGVVPEDENVVLSAAFGKPLLRYTRRGAAAACRRIAKRIQGNQEPISI